MITDSMFEETANIHTMDIMPKNILLKHEHGGYRHYYYVDNEEKLHFAPSVTTVTDKMLPTPQLLIDWFVKNGANREQLGLEVREYGTLMHIEIERCTVERWIGLDTNIIDGRIDEFLIKHTDRNKLLHLRKIWGEKLKSDLLAYNQFYIDYGIEPIATETPIYSHTMKLAGTLDMICYMNIGSGQNGRVLKADEKNNKTKKIKALIDFKSGRHEFYTNHCTQLGFYRKMHNIEFQDGEPITHVVNWSPKDWRTIPCYNLKIWSENLYNSNEYLNWLINGYYMQNAPNEFRERKISVIEGVLNLGAGCESVLTEMNMEEYLKKQYIKLATTGEKPNYFEE